MELKKPPIRAIQLAYIEAHNAQLIFKNVKKYGSNQRLSASLEYRTINNWYAT